MREQQYSYRAPGVYTDEPEFNRTVDRARMDVCAFVGVAPKGPSNIPVLPEWWQYDQPCVEPGREQRRSVAVPVESFAEYEKLYGGFEGPGRLPYAVANFFEQGGKRAYIVRIIHDYGSDPSRTGIASGVLKGVHWHPDKELRFHARNEGEWGNDIRVAIGFTSNPLVFSSASKNDLLIDKDTMLIPGSLLRITMSTGVIDSRVITGINKVKMEEGEFLRLSWDIALADEPLSCEIIEALLLIDDGTDYQEIHEGLGLSPLHPRYLATVLCYESILLYPDYSWSNEDIYIDDIENLTSTPVLPEFDINNKQFEGGNNCYEDIVPDDFFDSSWTLSDSKPGSGIYALVNLRDLSSVCTPDLYSPEPLPESEVETPVESFASDKFEPCVSVSEEVEDIADGLCSNQLTGLLLDPSFKTDRDTIVSLQQSIVALADAMSSWVALLDVPPGLSHSQLLQWRAEFNTSYAAAYYPWLYTSQSRDNRSKKILINPSAAAAGVIARQEIVFGVPHGPANIVIETVFDVSDQVSPARHDELHPQGLNIFVKERAGVRLSAARTLSRNSHWRQLSVRRLVLMLRRVLEQQMQWVVFEPNGPRLWASIRHLIRNFLRELYRDGAFRGKSEDEAFFVHCDETTNPRFITDAGKVITEIGVAPAEPLEFIVLRLIREGDGMLIAEA